VEPTGTVGRVTGVLNIHLGMTGPRDR